MRQTFSKMLLHFIGMECYTLVVYLIDRKAQARRLPSLLKTPCVTESEGRMGDGRGLYV